jgi:hypothetical protein
VCIGARPVPRLIHEILVKSGLFQRFVLVCEVPVELPKFRFIGLQIRYTLRGHSDLPLLRLSLWIGR